MVQGEPDIILVEIVNGLLVIAQREFCQLFCLPRGRILRQVK